MNLSQKSVQAPTGFRRRRVFWFFLGFLLLLFLFGVPWELPESLKDTGVSLSRANIAYLSFGKQTEPDEIYGLLHMVTQGKAVLSQERDLDVTEPINMTVYAAGDNHWDKHVKILEEKYPVIMFSKTYCGFSQKAKKLLATYNLSPPLQIVEVDLRDDGDLVKLILARLTGRSTFPNVIVKGKSIGGSDDIHALHSEGKLRDVLEGAGVQVQLD